MTDLLNSESTFKVPALELAFETKRLREICENEEIASQELGAEGAERLKHRLADLRAAGSIEELPDVAKPSTTPSPPLRISLFSSSQTANARGSELVVSQSQPY